VSKDFIGYDGLVDAALRGVVHQALRNIAERGLLGNHHIYLTFRTGHPGVEIPDFLRERYPDEMTIVLQHQYWGLEAEDNAFSVTLSFNKAKCTLTIPYAALTRFADPGVKFGLQFTPGGEAGVQPSRGAAGPAVVAPGPTEAGAKPVPAESPATTAAAPADQPAEKIIRLDTFRKK
jgi:hypothetical protein